MVGGLPERFSWPRHDVQAPEEPDCALRPTKTFWVLVAATRAGPEFVKPGTPPTVTIEPVRLSGSRRYIFCAPKSAAISWVPSGVSARPRICASGGGPPGGSILP